MPTFYGPEYPIGDPIYAAQVEEMRRRLTAAEKRVVLLEGLLREARASVHADLAWRIETALGVRAQLPDVVSTIEQAIAVERAVCTVCDGKGVTYSKNAGACPLPCRKCQP